MDKGLKIIGLGVLATFVAITTNAIVKAAGASNTADKLTVDFDDVKFTDVKYVKVFGISVPKSAIASIGLNLTNPTSNELEVSKPYISLFVVRSNGSKNRIANTATPTTEPTLIKANGQTKFIHDVEISFTNVLGVLPNFVNYAINRLRGAAASQKVLADLTLDALGVTISQSKTILI